MNMELNRQKIDLELEHLAWNYAELARRMGVARQSISQYLSRKTVNFKTVERIALALGLNAKDLLK